MANLRLIWQITRFASKQYNNHVALKIPPVSPSLTTGFVPGGWWYWRDADGLHTRMVTRKSRNLACHSYLLSHVILDLGIVAPDVCCFVCVHCILNIRILNVVDAGTKTEHFPALVKVFFPPPIALGMISTHKRSTI